MAFDENKPAINAPLQSSDVRDNFQYLKNFISKEHKWGDPNPDNDGKHNITVIVQGSTENDAIDYTSGNGTSYKIIDHVGSGITGNTYSLQTLLQELVSRSHRHLKEKYYFTDDNCNCNCQCSDGP